MNKTIFALAAQFAAVDLENTKVDRYKKKHRNNHKQIDISKKLKTEKNRKRKVFAKKWKKK